MSMFDDIKCQYPFHCKTWGEFRLQALLNPYASGISP
jgi:hypothetical protein